MPRKGWDNLSDAYRNRLLHNGISQSAYESGVALHGARGKGSASKEAFYKRAARFAHNELHPKSSRIGPQPIPGRTEHSIRERIKSMGRVRGTEYMNQVREMTRLYEAGYAVEARRMYDSRDTKLPDYMYFYHGIFGF